MRKKVQQHLVGVTNVRRRERERSTDTNVEKKNILKLTDDRNSQDGYWNDRKLWRKNDGKSLKKRKKKMKIVIRDAVTRSNTIFVI